MSGNQAEQAIARIISWVFHPLWIPLFALLLIFQLETLSVYLIADKVKWLIIGMVLMATLVFPLLIIMLFVRKGLVSSIKMERREERLYPYLLMMVVYYVMYLLFGSIKLPVIVNGLFLCVSLVILCVIIINIWWKVSIHTASIGGVTGIFTAIAIRYELDLLFLIALMMLISGLVGFARLKLNAHKPAQVYVGFLAGMMVSIVLYFLL
jgi:hypothetical protein